MNRLIQEARYWSALKRLTRAHRRWQAVKGPQQTGPALARRFGQTSVGPFMAQHWHANSGIP